MARGGSPLALSAENTPHAFTLPSQLQLSQGSQRQPRYCRYCRATKKCHPRASCFVAEDAGGAGDAGDGGALVEADGAGDEGRVATLPPVEGVVDGEDRTVLVEGEGAGGEGGFAVSLEALVDEYPDFAWAGHSWMRNLFKHSFGHYHEGFSGATLDVVITIERNDLLGLLRRRVFDEQRGCEDLIFLATDGKHFDVERRKIWNGNASDPWIFGKPVDEEDIAWFHRMLRSGPPQAVH
ncbi:hypothetical protein PsorP6_014713 [Peronosclerospora sorghi]|uniref:Uncharacterized protein n=1 Tax=Peronosclerospora sorghi TaxID=230839 RepID=A0ACC0VSB4_9STRA|nr:hypothetical protein PsorP6_014713 [Peronosclerospora sorghi]